MPEPLVGTGWRIRWSVLQERIPNQEDSGRGLTSWEREGRNPEVIIFEEPRYVHPILADLMNPSHFEEP